MANWAYLCATNRKVIYPSYGDRPYQPSKQIVASETYCIPLLWLGLFRPADLVKRTFVQEGERIVAEAPLCARMRAIRQFDAAWPYLEDMFHECGSLEEHAELFRQALVPLKYRYLTIELEEIACMAKSRRYFYGIVRAALKGMNKDYSTEAYHRFVYLAQLFKLKRFPPARLFLDDIKGTDDDYLLHGRILGSQDMGRKVPWYPK